MIYLIDDEYYGLCSSCGKGEYEINSCPHCFQPCCYDCVKQIEDGIHVCPECQREYCN